MGTKHISGGLLIAIDGIDGAGKTTLAMSLRDALVDVGLSVRVSKEPTAGPWGTRLRESAQQGRLPPDEELRLLLLDRKQHVAEVIAPALARGEVVILDRYYFSTVAYQGAAGIPIAQILSAHHFAPVPDVYLLLDVDPSAGIRRIHSRGDRPNYFEDFETLRRCREIFLETEIPSRFVIDAAQAIEQVHARAHALVLLGIADKIRRIDGLTPEAVEKMRELLPNLSN